MNSLKNRTPAKAVVFALLLTVVGTAAFAAQPYGPGPQRGPEMMRLRLDMLNQYFNIVSAVHEVARNPEKAVAFNLQQLEENYKKQGRREEIVKMYQKLLKDTRNQTLRNIAYMKLSEIHKRSGNSEQAVGLLKQALSENMKRLK